MSSIDREIVQGPGQFLSEESIWRKRSKLKDVDPESLKNRNLCGTVSLFKNISLWGRTRFANDDGIKKKSKRKEGVKFDDSKSIAGISTTSSKPWIMTGNRIWTRLLSQEELETKVKHMLDSRWESD